MALFYGHESKFLRANRTISTYAALVYLIYFAIIIVIIFWRLSIAQFSLPAILAMVIVFGPLLLVTDSFMRKEESLIYKFRSGILGEKFIADELRKLDNSFTVFQDVVLPGKKGNIDFVVVGPTGIFTIEVKNHRGKVGFNGSDLTLNNRPFERDFLFQAMREATSLHDYLIQNNVKQSFVLPIILFSHRFASVRFGIQPVKHVRVIQYHWLIKMISSEPRSYPDEKVVDLLKGTYTSIH